MADANNNHAYSQERRACINKRRGYGCIRERTLRRNPRRPSDIASWGSFVATITVTGFSVVSGAAYPLKLVTPTGGVFSYSVIAGGAS